MKILSFKYSSVIKAIILISLFIISSIVKADELDVYLTAPYKKFIINISVPENADKTIFSFKARIDSEITNGGSFQLTLGMYKEDNFFPITTEYLVAARELIMSRWTQLERSLIYNEMITIYYLFLSPDFQANTLATAGNYFVRLGNPYLFEFDFSSLLLPGESASLNILNWNGAFNIGTAGSTVILGDMSIQYFNKNGDLILGYNPSISGVLSP